MNLTDTIKAMVEDDIRSREYDRKAKEHRQRAFDIARQIAIRAEANEGTVITTTYRRSDS